MIFLSCLNQTLFLLSFIVIGFVLSERKIVPENAQSVLSRIENYLFVPALVMGTFIDEFTMEKLSVALEVLAYSFLLEVIVIIVSVLIVRLVSKERYKRNIYLYGLCFSNFGFMGNAVVSAVFPEIFVEYLIFTLPLWVLIYMWGVPALLMDSEGRATSLLQRLKNVVNPMFVGMILGMLIGLLQIPIPGFLHSVIFTAGECMSPVAMLLTGMTIAQMNIKEVLSTKSIYTVTALRLLVYPLVFIGVLWLCPLHDTIAICAVCSLAMPLGLNTIIIPSAYGKDVRIASGMALVSHVLSCVTIPAVIWLFECLV